MYLNLGKSSFEVSGGRCLSMQMENATYQHLQSYGMAGRCIPGRLRERVSGEWEGRVNREGIEVEVRVQAMRAFLIISISELLRTQRTWSSAFWPAIGMTIWSSVSFNLHHLFQFYHSHIKSFHLLPTSWSPVHELKPGSWSQPADLGG